MRFKVGDRVRRVTESHNPNYFGVVGGVYTVLKVDVECSIEVVSGFAADSSCFKLVEKKGQLEFDF